MTTTSSGLVLLLLLLLTWRIWMWWCPRNQIRPAVAAQTQRLLKPRTPNDCPTCCQQAAAALATAPSTLSAPPWRDRKSRRGAPKRIATQGFACPHRACLYYQVSDAQIHALVGDGTHGKTERIQTFRCQACQTTFSARRNTPLYRIKTASHRVADVGRRAQRWQLVAGLIYGHVKKTYQRRKLVRVTQVMRCSPRVELSVALKQLGLSGRINTAFIERLNLTVRQMVAALVRRTWSSAQEAPQLLAHLHWWQAYYHLVRPHESLRVVLAQPIERGGKRVPQREKATDTGNGCRTDTQALERPRGAGASARANTDRWRLT